MLLKPIFKPLLGSALKNFSNHVCQDPFSTRQKSSSPQVGISVASPVIQELLVFVRKKIEQKFAHEVAWFKPTTDQSQRFFDSSEVSGGEVAFHTNTILPLELKAKGGNRTVQGGLPPLYVVKTDPLRSKDRTTALRGLEEPRTGSQTRGTEGSPSA